MDYNVLCNGKSIAKTASSTNKKGFININVNSVNWN